MTKGFKTLEKKYGIAVRSEGQWYAPRKGKMIETFKIFTADGCQWENGLSRDGVKKECETYGEEFKKIAKKAKVMNKEIRLLTTMEGEILIDKKARPGVSVKDICEIAENEVYGGYADYARVTINGEIYMELEA